VRKIVPEVVIGDETKENLGMNYAELVPVLINAIKQQQQQIDALKKEQQQDREALLELQDLKKQIQELAAEIKPNKK
jgi:flagellar biosynthesis chaperone FliJ